MLWTMWCRERLYRCEWTWIEAKNDVRCLCIFYRQCGSFNCWATCGRNCIVFVCLPQILKELFCCQLIVGAIIRSVMSAVPAARVSRRRPVMLQNVDLLKAKKQELKQQLKEMTKNVKLQMQKKRRLIRAAHKLQDEDLLWLLKRRQGQVQDPMNGVSNPPESPAANPAPNPVDNPVADPPDASNNSEDADIVE